MIKKFKYESHGEIKERNLFVIYESKTSLEGLDLDVLGADGEKEVTEALKEYNPTDGSNRKPIEGYKSEWTKAWRNFTKSKIVKDEPKEESKDK